MYPPQSLSLDRLILCLFGTDESYSDSICYVVGLGSGSINYSPNVNHSKYIDNERSWKNFRKRLPPIGHKVCKKTEISRDHRTKTNLEINQIYTIIKLKEYGSFILVLSLVVWLRQLLLLVEPAYRYVDLVRLWIQADFVHCNKLAAKVAVKIYGLLKEENSKEVIYAFNTSKIF